MASGPATMEQSIHPNVLHDIAKQGSFEGILALAAQ